MAGKLFPMGMASILRPIWNWTLSQSRLMSVFRGSRRSFWGSTGGSPWNQASIVGKSPRRISLRLVGIVRFRSSSPGSRSLNPEAGGLHGSPNRKDSGAARAGRAAGVGSQVAVAQFVPEPPDDGVEQTGLENRGLLELPSSARLELEAAARGEALDRALDVHPGDQVEPDRFADVAVAEPGRGHGDDVRDLVPGHEPGAEGARGQPDALVTDREIAQAVEPALQHPGP